MVNWLGLLVRFICYRFGVICKPGHHSPWRVGVGVIGTEI
jgi:hypothetical protein